MGPRSTNPYALPDGVTPDRAVCPRCHPGRLILQFNHVATVVDAKTRCKRMGLVVTDCSEYRSGAPDCVTDAQDPIGGTNPNFLHRAWLNVDLLWTVTLLIAGVVTLFS